jgi:uncharacterized protein YjdB
MTVAGTTLAATGCGDNTAARRTSDLQSITIAPSPITLGPGATLAVTATGVYSDGTTVDVTATASWSTSDATVATVGAAAGGGAAVTAVAVGQATVTASVGSISGSGAVTVTAAALSALAVTPPQASIARGATQAFTATGTYSDGTTADLTAQAAWSTGDATIAAMLAGALQPGMAQGMAVGQTDVTATVGQVSGSATLTVTAAVLRAIDVTPGQTTLPVGETQGFVATGTYSDGTTADITAVAAWTSSDVTTASVSSAAGFQGVAIARARGSATITATLDSVSGSAALSVTDAVLASIDVTPATTSLPVGMMQALAATGVFTDGTTHDLTAQVTWTSSDQTVVRVSNATGAQGQATAVAPGPVTVTAALGGVSGSATINATPATLTSITLSPARLTLPAGMWVPVQASGTYSDGTNRDITGLVTWSSSDTTVLTVVSSGSNAGRASGVAKGGARLSAALGTASASLDVTVTDATLTGLAVTPDRPLLVTGTSQQMAATATFSDGTTLDVTAQSTWASSDTTVASISNAAGGQGLVSALKPGQATLSATLGGLTGGTTLTVSSAALMSIAVAPAGPSLPLGVTQSFTAMGLFADGSMQDLTAQVAWTSSDVTVVAISNASTSPGLATALAVGNVTVTATYTGISGQTMVDVVAAALVSLSVSPANPTLAKGSVRGFDAVGIYSDGSTKDLTTQVTWSSSDATVVSVSNTQGSAGMGTCLAAGIATVSAALSGVTGSTTVTVTPAVMVSLSIEPPTPSLANGTSLQLSAIATFSDATTQDVTGQVDWGSSDTTVATVSNAAGQHGMLKAVGIGMATASAQLGGLSASTGVTVTAATLVSLSLSPANGSIAKGTTLQMAVTGSYSDGSSQDLTTQATWTTSDGTVAAIGTGSPGAGLASGLGIGTATISAAFGGQSASTQLTVTAAQLISISVSPPALSLAKGTGQGLTATGTYSDATTQDLTTQVSWTSSDNTVVVVSNSTGSQGRVTAVAIGSASVTATLSGVSGSAAVTVTGAVLTSIAVTPANPSLAKGTQAQLAASGTYSDGTVQDLTTQVSWSSSDTTVLTIANSSGNQGRASAVAPGMATASATLSGITGSTTVTVTAAVLTSITVAPATLSLAKGTSQGLTATGTYSDATTQDLTAQVSWTSSDNTIAAVSNGSGTQGRVTAVAVGSASVTATLSGVMSGSASVTVTAAVLNSIAVTPPNPSLAKGTQAQLAASGTYSDGTVQDLTAQVSWTSSDSTVAAVSSTAGTQGRVTGAGIGTATVSATLSGVTGSTTVTVTSAVLTSIALTPPNPSLAKGTALQLVATGTYSDGTNQDLTAQVGWSSSDNTVVVVSNSVGSQGRATGAGVGSATVSATLSGVTGSTTVTVTSAVLTSIDVTPTNPSLAKGTQAQLAASGTYSDGTVQDLTAQVSWTSSNNPVATVSNGAGTQGRLTGVALGTATISATLSGVTGSTDATVTDAVLTSITVTPTNPSLAKGTALQLTATGTYSDGTNQDVTTQAIWTAGDGTVAIVSNASGSQGRVTGAGAGTTAVTAALSGVTGSTSVTVTAATLVSIGITPADSTLAKGTVEQLIATGVYSDSSTQDLTAQVTWSSSAPSVATVSNGAGTQGLATANGTGIATITALLGGVSGTTTITGTNATLVSIDVNPVDPTMAAGTKLSFTATGTFSDGTIQDLTAQATWVSTNNAAATVSNAAGSQGLVTAVAAGTATVSASWSGVSDTSTVTVTNASLTALAVSPTNPRAAKGTTVQFTAIGTFSDGSTQDVTAQVTWNSSQTAVASISNAAGAQGLATGLVAGNTTITATLFGVQSSTTMTVTNAVITSVSITPANPSLPRGYRLQLRAIGSFSDGSTQDLTTQATWTSSATLVATVSSAPGSKGRTTGIAAGTTTISATALGTQGTTVLTVTNATLASIAVTPTPLNLSMGQTQQLTATGTFSDGTTLDLTTQVHWTSSSKKTASVNGAGVVRARKKGTATISASNSGKTGTAAVTVN